MKNSHGNIAAILSREPGLTYHYFAYGLNIDSEIECPELLNSEGNFVDVRVRIGRVPSHLERIQARGEIYEIAEDRFLLNIKRTARYLVTEGKEIIVQIDPLADPQTVRLFLLGSTFGALLHQRGLWPLHGSAIVTERGAALFVGVSGNGKSTLAAAFNQRGYPILSDDVCAVKVNTDGTVQLWPAYPRLNLWSDAVVKLGNRPEALSRSRHATDKYQLPVVHFNPEAVPICAIYALGISDQPEINLLPLKGFEKARELTTNTYRLHFLWGMRLEKYHFTRVQALARQARLVRVTRPREPFLLDELMDQIEKDLSQCPNLL